jgi:hypothetical protein
LLHYWERSLNTHDWNDFWPRLFLFAFSAASGEIASGNFSFCQCCISKRLGRDISVLALLSRTHIARCCTVSTMYPLNPVFITFQSHGFLFRGDLCHIEFIALGRGKKSASDCSQFRPYVRIALAGTLDGSLSLLILADVSFASHDITSKSRTYTMLQRYRCLPTSFLVHPR